MIGKSDENILSELFATKEEKLKSQKSEEKFVKSPSELIEKIKKENIKLDPFLEKNVSIIKEQVYFSFLHFLNLVYIYKARNR